MAKSVILMLMLFFNLLVIAQPIYNDCNNAFELCPNQTSSLTNIGANKTFCPNCEDDVSFCFTSNNTIWLTFTTNTVGGDVQVNFSNLIFELNPGQDNELQAIILSASVPCNSSSYTAVGNCVSNGTSSFVLSALGLPPNSTYYVLINGDFNGVGITSAAECSFDVSLSGTGIERPIPSVLLNAGSLAICQNDIFTVTGSLTNCPENTNFRWFINGVLSAETSDSIFQTSNLSDGDIVSVETSCFLLCAEVVTSTTLPVSVYSFPVDAGPDQTIVSGQTIQLNGSTSATIYVWSPSFSLSDDLTLSPLAFPENTTTYTLTATENGCVLDDYVTITIDENLVIPTTFSPNEDGINDSWEITGVDQYPNCFVKIFDRWGQEIYQSTGYSKIKAWDGTGRSGKLSEGVYFYIIELRDLDKQEFKGSITLIR